MTLWYSMTFTASSVPCSTSVGFPSMRHSGCTSSSRNALEFCRHTLIDRGRCHRTLHFNSKIVSQKFGITHLKLILHLGLELGDDGVTGAGDDQVINIDAHNQPPFSAPRVDVVLRSAPRETKRCHGGIELGIPGPGCLLKSIQCFVKA
jgi:hypothetical protein